MNPVTRADRERELEALLAEIKAHPERDMSAERERAAVLRRTLDAGHDA
ncbi:hypothetical protein [Croceibacterium aestuarii]|nr:hypothetical protein [Croceibacterium sp. D39]